MSEHFFSVVICSIEPMKFAQTSACYEHLLAGVPHEIVGIHDATSLAEGYNRGLRLTQGDIVIFSHDDILILDDGFAGKIARRLETFDILGFAGTRKLVNAIWWCAGMPWICGAVAHACPQSLTLGMWNAEPWPVVDGIQAIDGLCVMTRREVAEEIGFDEITFDGFHLYDLDFSFSAWRMGKKIGVCCDIPVIHASMGRYDEQHKEYSRRFLEKHRDALHHPPAPDGKIEGWSTPFADHRALIAEWRQEVFQRTALKAQRQTSARHAEAGVPAKVFPPHPLALKYCTGKGVELGAALHNPFGLADCLNVAPSDGVRFLHPRDLEDYKKYANEQMSFAQSIARVDEVGDFQHIPFDAESLDYVISSHVIEHEPNPVAAFVESARVLKEGGIVFCIIPKRTAEMQSDIFLPLTSLDESIAAYREARTIENYPTPPRGWREHYYRYSLQSMLRLINWINREKLATFCVEAVEETDGKVGNGHTVVLRKSSPGAMPETDYSQIVEMCIRENRYEAGLQAAKNALSYDFFQVPILYAAALLAFQTGNLPEAREFYRQCLLLDPECAARRQEFAELFGEVYMNPLR